jgi:beta-fructofuranosidase
VYSRFHAPNAGTVYRVADTPYGPFRIPRDGSHGRLDGRRWYAAKSCPKAGDPTKRISFGWIGDYVDEERKWLWGGDLGVPREIAADHKGNLQLSPVHETIQYFEQTSRQLLQPSQRLSLSSIGATKLKLIEGGRESEDILLRFSVGRCDAHSFGLLLRVDGTQKGHRLQFTPNPYGTYTATLLTDCPPLDDFWADQYNLHLPRLVDGPEIVRHENMSLDGGVLVLLRKQLVEAFFGGRSISFRLPMPQIPCGQEITEPQRLCWFIEDGDVELTNVSISVGGKIDKLE